jgi:ABC-type Na+ transport system ATPase subunit NatA
VLFDSDDGGKITIMCMIADLLKTVFGSLQVLGVDIAAVLEPVRDRIFTVRPSVKLSGGMTHSRVSPAPWSAPMRSFV